MKLKVYCWSGFRFEALAGRTGRVQTREIAAAESKKAVLTLMGLDKANQLWNFHVTGNDKEIEKAMSLPGTVFWKGLDDRTNNWTQAAPVVAKIPTKTWRSTVQIQSRENRKAELERKAEAKKLLEELENQIFIGKMRGLLRGFESGVLNQNEFMLAFKEFVKAEKL